jgi:two-component system CheB/CheR fusion protein
MRPTKRKPSRKGKAANPLAAAPPRAAEGPAPNHEATAGETGSRASAPGFPIVAIGGSAGALAALQDLFLHTPGDCGLAFVVIVHADPNTPSLLPELLARWTRMTVQEASDGQRVERNRVYVVPPGRDVRVRSGALAVNLTKERRRIPLPIDALLRSLAEDQRHRAVGIVLSGTGADGTVGLAAIHAESGLAIAQEPSSAEFGGMPGSAIAAGAVDLVLPTAEIPERLLAYAAMLAEPNRAQATPARAGDELDHILAVVHRATGRDFSSYKRGTLQRRIERRMHLLQLSKMADYAAFLEAHPGEAEALWKDWLIGVSHFFRDAESFAALAEFALPRLVAAKEDGSFLRVWVPGCATGEEAYTIGMLVLEAIEKQRKRLEIQIFATDLDARALEVGRAGRYPEGIAADVSEERLRRFFVKEDRHYRVKKELRDLTVFAFQDLLRDPPFTRMDLISCRNLLIYLAGPAQKRLIPLFHYSLLPGGLLLLGSSETVVGFDDLFTAADKRSKLYRRKETGVSTRPPIEWASRSAASVAGEPAHERPARPNLDLADLVRRHLAEQYAPPTLIVDERGDIEQIHGRTGEYLEPAPGKASLNAIEMAREGLRAPLAAALRQVGTTAAKEVERKVRIRTNGALRSVKLSVSRLYDANLGRPLLLVSFTPVEGVERGTGKRPLEPAPSRRARGRSAQLEQELEATRSDLQSTIEELQASNEELASSNEEVQSVNEELQSTNEELQTAKEETQSLNEELQTVNAELTAKVHDLEESNDDLLNLINSTDIAMLFLDNHLRVKRFTPEAQRLFRLIPSDAGRPLADQTNSLAYPDLIADAERVLETLAPLEREVRSSDGSWYSVRIRLYRTSRNAIEGLMLVFNDVTHLKKAENEAKLATGLAEATIDAVREPLLVLDSELRVTRANRSFYRKFGVLPAETVGQPLFELGDGHWDIPKLRELLDRVMKENQVFDDFEFRHSFPALGNRVMLLNARRIEQTPGSAPGMILLVIDDITGRDAARPSHPEAGP